MREAKVTISISVKNSLLSKIEKHIEGKSRSEKLCKCADAGFKLLTNPKTFQLLEDIDDK